MMFADLFADASTSTYHQFVRLQTMSEWWHWLLLVAVVVGVVGYVVRVYRRDTMELSRGLALVLLALRISVFLGVLFYFMDLERRTERRLVKNSRAILLVDTSQSMSIVDPESRGTNANRLEAIVRELGAGNLLNDLRKLHDVIVYRFDQTPRPTEIGTFSRTTKNAEPELAGEDPERQRSQARITLVVAVVLLLGAAVCAGKAMLSRPVAASQEAKSDATSWSGLVAVVLLISGLVVLAVASLRSPNFDLRVTLGLKELGEIVESGTGNEAIAEATELPADHWKKELVPRGVETRIGDVIEYLVSRERGGAVAGIVLFTDGGQNAGQSPALAIAAARDAGIPIHVVGLGSDTRPTNVRVVDIEVPERVYPGDRFTLTGLIQSFGLAGRAGCGKSR